VDLKPAIAAHLDAARRRSLALLDPLPPQEQTRQHSPLMSPLVWDLAHVGNYEELWLVRAVAEAPPIDPAQDDVYNAFEHPRAERPSLPMLAPAEARAYIAEVRGRALEALDGAEVDSGDELLGHGFVYGMVVQHEHQHDETMLATRQLMGERALPLEGVATPPAGREVASETLVPAGPFVMGSDLDPWAYDNERPAHEVDTPAFFIDTAPVANRSYLAFIEDGGYGDPRWWTGEGWRWRREASLEHPEFWRREGGGSWSLLRFGRRIPLPPDEPVQHVCWYEADAFARWAGKRLPTEAEWEKAASWGPDGRKRRYPWGDGEPSSERANLGQRHDGPAPIGAYPTGASAYGCEQLVGDVWEWTASDFAAYPGFRSFPYREYSEVFFGAGYKVLRGGSWAADPVAVRTTFRNWDYPVRRQIFAGFRCARDA
jgi:iron(II)-dependent oxidoreductase